MKDIVGDEICVWSFYGHQRKVAEICCTSIVYATEKKQTKVSDIVNFLNILIKLDFNKSLEFELKLYNLKPLVAFFKMAFTEFLIHRVV